MNIRKLKLTLIFVTGLYTCSYTQKPAITTRDHSPLEMDSILKQGPEYDFINPLIGNWKVVQTIYSKDGGKIIVRDTFKVERKMIGNFLQEIMHPIVTTETNSFTRISYLNYNRTNLGWEYIVLDSRYPLMMYERSVDYHVAEDSTITLYLDNFVLPPFWGMEFAGMLAKERRVFKFGSKENVNKQYWTLPAGKEFLAIEYIYKKALNQ